MRIERALNSQAVFKELTFKALACDYDGTIASDDRIGPEAVTALDRARGAGVKLILVTGRTFFELIRVCERLDLFDAVVAENGGVVYFPGQTMIRDLAPPPPPELIRALDRDGVSFLLGRVIVGTARGDEERVRKSMAEAGARLDIVYNRAALMLVPAGVAKGKAVRQVIRELGLSFHDVLALGDAENDADLFEACGWTACPENAVPELKGLADWVFPGDDGAAIAAAIAGPILNGGLPPTDSPRHRIEVGWTPETSEQISIPAQGVNVLVHGDPLSGKSWFVGGLVERLLGGDYATLVIDPEGDFHVLGRLPGVSWVEVREPASWEPVLDHFHRNPSACVIADLSMLPHASKVRSIEKGLELVRQLRRHLGLPHWVVLDEAHYTLHRRGVAEEAIGLEAKGFCLATYRASWLRERVLKEMDVVVLARTTIPDEVAFLDSYLGAWGVEVTAVLRALPRGEFVLVQAERTGARSALTFVAPPRQTHHIRHLRKYADSPLPPDKRFLFRRPDGTLVATAETLDAFRRLIASVDEQALAHHARRGDFSRWLFGVFADAGLGSQLRKIEARWTRGEIPDLRGPIERLIAASYGE